MGNSDVQNEVSDKFSLRGRVFNYIRDGILEGRYKENEELRENNIAKELGVSRTPVREALRQLELEGLVSIIPNKGAHVTGISEKDVKDIYMIRSYLEGLCARMACENITNDVLEALEEVVYLSEFHAKKGHYEQVVELDNKFHECIYNASESKILKHMLSDCHRYVKRARRSSLSTGGRAEQSNTEHMAILEAFRQKDAKKAEMLAKQHISNTIEHMKHESIENL